MLDYLVKIKIKKDWDKKTEKIIMKKDKII